MKNGARWTLVAAMMAIPAVALGAQERPRRGGLGPADVDRAAARALRLGDEIELTDAQRQQLRELRSEALSALESWERESLDTRQELRARRRQLVADPETTQGELGALREEVRTRMDELRTRRRELTAPIQERYENIVGAEQRLRLRELGRSERGRVARGRTMRDRWGRGEVRRRDGPPSRRGRGPEGPTPDAIGNPRATPGG
jgi:Spy/CpxP family protein refolding chaperone